MSVHTERVPVYHVRCDGVGCDERLPDSLDIDGPYSTEAEVDVAVEVLDWRTVSRWGQLHYCPTCAELLCPSCSRWIGVRHPQHECVFCAVRNGRVWTGGTWIAESPGSAEPEMPDWDHDTVTMELTDGPDLTDTLLGPTIGQQEPIRYTDPPPPAWHAIVGWGTALALAAATWVGVFTLMGWWPF